MNMLELGVIKSPIFTDPVSGETGDYTLEVKCSYTEFMLARNHREYLNRVVVDHVRSAAQAVGIPTDEWLFETKPDVAEIYSLPHEIAFKSGTL
jgi:hypothetical protein